MILAGGWGGWPKVAPDRPRQGLLAGKAKMLSTGGWLGGVPPLRREKAAAKWLSGWLAGITEMGRRLMEAQRGPLLGRRLRPDSLREDTPLSL